MFGTVLPNPAGIGANHRLASLAVPGLLELRHVFNHALYAVFSRRMRIDAEQQAGKLRPPLFAPHPRESQKIPLLGRVAVHLLRSLTRFVLCDDPLQSRQRDACSAVVGSVFTQRQLAVGGTLHDYGNVARGFYGRCRGRTTDRTSRDQHFAFRGRPML
jgi:hypothetical protein